MSDFEIPDGAVVTDIELRRGGSTYRDPKTLRRQLIRPRLPLAGDCTVIKIEWFFAGPNGGKTAGTYMWRPALNEGNSGMHRTLPQVLFWRALLYIDKKLGKDETNGGGTMSPEDTREFMASGKDIQIYRARRYTVDADRNGEEPQFGAPLAQRWKREKDRIDQVEARMKRQQDRIQALDDAIMESKGEEITVICRIAEDKIVHRALPGHGVRMIWEEVPLAENKAVRRENGYDAYIRDETELAKKRLKETLANQIPSPPKVRLCVCGKPLEYYVEIHDDHTTWTRFIAPRFQCSANPEVDAGSHQ